MNNWNQSKILLILAIIIGAVLLLFFGRELFVPANQQSFLNQSPSGKRQITTPVQEFKTCTICGYRSIIPDTLLCPICYVELTESERILWEYESMEEMIAEEQANFFAAEGFRDSGLFFAPRIWKIDGAAYAKDTAWRPVVDSQSVVMLRDTLLERGIVE